MLCALSFHCTCAFVLMILFVLRNFEVLSVSVQRPSANCNSACRARPCCGKQNLLRSMLRCWDALFKLLTDLLQDSHHAQHKIANVEVNVDGENPSLVLFKIQWTFYATCNKHIAEDRDFLVVLNNLCNSCTFCNSTVVRTITSFLYVSLLPISICTA